MNVPSSTSAYGSRSGFSLMGAGARAQLTARLDQQLLGDAGLLTEDLATGLSMIESAGQSMVSVGVEKSKHDLLGQIFDARG